MSSVRSAVQVSAHLISALFLSFSGVCRVQVLLLQCHKKPDAFLFIALALVSLLLSFPWASPAEQ